jgi:hypothetical protein
MATQLMEEKEGGVVDVFCIAADLAQALLVERVGVHLSYPH